MNATHTQQHAYRALLGRFAQLEEETGGPLTADDLKSLQLSESDLGALTELHLVDFVDAFAEDPTKLARLFMGTLSPLELLLEVLQPTLADSRVGPDPDSRERLAQEFGLSRELQR